MNSIFKYALTESFPSNGIYFVFNVTCFLKEKRIS